MNWKICVCILFSGVYMQAHEMSDRLRDCLAHLYLLNQQEVVAVIQKFQPLLESDEHDAVLEQFIALSKIHVSENALAVPEQPLPADDAVIAAPEYHEVVAENDMVRVLYGASKPDEKEPLHRHYWKSILVNLFSTVFEIDYADGSTEMSDDPIGVYELPPDTQAATYKNIGKEAAFLRFEIKQ